jgi:hypothetical protein
MLFTHPVSPAETLGINIGDATMRWGNILCMVPVPVVDYDFLEQEISA